MFRRLSAVLLMVAAMVAALTMATIAPAGAAGASSGLEIRNTGSQLCLQPIDNSFELGAAIVQEPCNGTVIQAWTRTFNSDFTNRFVNQGTGLCLDARGGATNGTPVQQWTCDSISNEKWAAANSLPAVTQIVSRVSNTTSHCLDDPNGSTEPRTAMQTFKCNTTSAQVWFVG